MGREFWSCWDEYLGYFWMPLIFQSPQHTIHMNTFGFYIKLNETGWLNRFYRLIFAIQLWNINNVIKFCSCCSTDLSIFPQMTKRAGFTLTMLSSKLISWTGGMWCLWILAPCSAFHNAMVMMSWKNYSGIAIEGGYLLTWDSYHEYRVRIHRLHDADKIDKSNYRDSFKHLFGKLVDHEMILFFFSLSSRIRSDCHGKLCWRDGSKKMERINHYILFVALSCFFYSYFNRAFFTHPLITIYSKINIHDT